MLYKIKLNTGLELEFENDYENVIDEFYETFNNQNISFVSIGDNFLGKHSILYIKPFEEEEEVNYQLTLSNGEVFNLKLEETLDTSEFLQKLNSQGEYFVSIGGVIFQKHLLNTLIKVK